MPKIKKENLIQINFQNDSYLIREETYQGKTYIVVPVTMMVEGVHNGSHGALLHTIGDLGRFPASWDGIPIVIDHPQVDGINVSANSPDIIEGVGVGQVFGTNVNGSRLKAEAWLDKNKLAEVSPEAYQIIENKEMLEVSVGVFTEDEEVNGDWNGEKYNAIARNHRPDHLALLPGGTGACSVKDGCGIRLNKKGGVIKMNRKKIVPEETLFMKMQSNKLNEEAVFDIVDNSTTGLMEQISELRDLINTMDTQEESNYLEEVYDSYLIYQKYTKSNGEKIYKQNFQMDAASNEYVLVGNPVEVEKQINYVNVNKSGTKITRFKKEVKTMSEEKKTPCGNCMEKVIAIINSNETTFTKDDREWLLVQEEAILDKLMPKVAEVVVNKDKKEAVQITAEQVINALSAEDKAALSYGKKQLAEKRATMIKGIQDNVAKDTWTEVELKAMDENILEKIFNSVKKEEVAELVDYSLMSQGRHIDNNTEEIEPLLPTGVEFDVIKK
jgi:hypothetical protein